MGTRNSDRIMKALENIIKSIERTTVRLDLTEAKEALKEYAEKKVGTKNFRNYPAVIEVSDYHSIPSYRIPEIGVKCKEISPESFGYEFHGTCGLMYYGLIYRDCLPDKKVIVGLLEKKLKKTMWRKFNGHTVS